MQSVLSKLSEEQLAELGIVRLPQDFLLPSLKEKGIAIWVLTKSKLKRLTGIDDKSLSKTLALLERRGIIRREDINLLKVSIAVAKQRGVKVSLTKVNAREVYHLDQESMRISVRS